MYDRILFPTDGSDVATAVFDEALDLAADHDATLYLLNVADTNRDSVSVIKGEVVDVLEREGERILEDLEDRARDRGVEVVTDVLQGPPASTIVDYAESYDVDLIVMPTHGRRGIERLMLGSVTERVVRTSPVEVLTVRPEDQLADRYPYQTILVPTDGSECAEEALAAAIELATASGASLHVVNVVDTTGLGIDVRSIGSMDRLEEAAQEIVERAVRTATEASVQSVTSAVEHGSVVEQLNDYVTANDVDLIVAGTHGRTGVDRFLLGSVAERLVRSASVPVMTVGDLTAD